MSSFSLYQALEYLGVGTGLLYLGFAIYQRRICWVFYIVSAFSYIPVMAHEGLYLYSAMQLFFAATGAYGWWSWGKSAGERFSVQNLSVAEHVRYIVGGVALSALFLIYLAQLGSFWNAFADSLMSIFSLIATFLTARKLLDGWRYWVAVNVLAVTTYVLKGMWPTALLYSVYLVSSAYGVWHWGKEPEAGR